MNGRIGIVFFLIMFLTPLPNVWSGATFDRVVGSNTVRLGAPYNIIPHGFLNPSGEWAGFEVDLATELARHMNLKLDLVKVNEKTWRSMLSKGQIDAALCRIVHRRSLENEFDFSVPYFFDSPQVLVLKGSSKAVSDLKGQKIAAVQGSIFEKTAMSLLRQAGDDAAQKNVVSFPDRPACFMSLGKDKIGGWLDSGMTLMEYSAKSPGRFELIPAGDSVEVVAIGLPSNDSAWRDLVNFALQDMAADGTWKRIYDKWFGPDAPHPLPAKRTIEIWPE